MRGVYQWCGSEPMTKFGMIRSMGAALGMDVSHVRGNAEKPRDDGGTKRPRDTTMDRYVIFWSFDTNYLVILLNHTIRCPPYKIIPYYHCLVNS